MNFEVEIKNYSDDVKKEFDAATERALEAVGLYLEGEAKIRCPVDTGLLRNSITHALSGQQAAVTSYKADSGSASGEYRGAAPGSQDEAAVYIGTNVEYARAVEMGIGQKAQPYLYPAIANNTKEAGQIFKEYFER